MASIKEGLTGLVFSADELRAITDWDDRVIEDYLALVRNIRQLASFADLDAAQVAANTAAIIVNANAIAVNAGNIATNAGNISTNTTNISNNASAISVNAGNISSNAASIVANANAIAVNAGNIATNTGNISTNATNISNNAAAIIANALAISNHIADTGNPHSVTFTQAVTADPATNITAAEAETLSDGSNADLLHKHAVISDGTDILPAVTLAETIANIFRVTTTSIVRFVVDGAGNLAASFYPQDTRDDGTVSDEKVLTTDNSGNILLRRVLPYSESITDADGGVNQLITFVTYMTLNFTVPEDGDYILAWDYVWSLNASNRNFLGRVLLDGATVVHNQVEQPSSAAGTGVLLPDLNGGADINTGTDQRLCCSGFEKRTLTAGARTLEIQLSSDQADNEAAIYKGSLKVTRDA